ncbi:hypothetical protein TanjilG_19143 [Lupinus angustifolius]|uniref:Uncharacterized protein n=1 Tax=Lupinus angustifolius TaxID=3871 RepID=A0A4P1RS17_LUPAN|nr:PREDICTED: uncharacterized protein LOC109329332 [Lupinus angustifolius]OIW16427.1 hypothetical protein TanjilG_19143 [Lupinus angustifolius]
MGRQNNDPRSVNSSIALLQQRFRELEKVKERREGKQLVRLLSHDSSISSQNSLQHSKLMDPPHRPSLNDSLSLGLNLTSKKSDHNTMKLSPPPSLNSWPKKVASTSTNFDSSEVDTSLHL